MVVVVVSGLRVVVGSVVCKCGNLARVSRRLCWNCREEMAGWSYRNEGVVVWKEAGM